MSDDIVPRPQPQPQPVRQPTSASYDVVKQAPGSEPLPDENTTPQASIDSQKAQLTQEPEVRPEFKKQKSDKPIGIIVGAILICALLISGVIYLQLKKDSSPTQPTTVNKVTKQQPVTAQGGSVDTAISEAESLASQSGESSADLSDQALGL